MDAKESMLSKRRRTIFALVRLFILACSLVAILDCSAPCHSQQNGLSDDPPLDVEVEAELEDEQNLLRMPGAFARMDRAAIRESMFGALGGSEAAFQKLKRESIQREVDRYNSICELNSEQMEKLNQAVEIDIQQIHNKIETLLSGYDNKMTIQDFQRIQQEVSLFAQKVNSNQSDGNEFWRKIMRAQLTKEQLAKLDDEKRASEENRLKTKRMHHLLSLQRKLGLDTKQRTIISEWLDSEDITSTDFVLVWNLLMKSKDVVETLTPYQRKVLQKPLTPVTPVRPVMNMDPFQ